MELSTLQRDYNGLNSKTISKPKLIGYYSLDSNREYKDDCSELKFIQHERVQPQKVNFDLNHLIKERKHRLQKTEGLRGFLNYLKLHRNEVDVFSKKQITMENVPFVCCRGSLRAISKQPYEHNESTRLSIFLANGIIYMHILETPEMKKRKEEMTEREQTMAAWGYKFEQYMVTDSLHNDPDLSSPADENSELNCIFTSYIGNHKLIYGAEVDGLLIERNQEAIQELQRNKINNSRRGDLIECLGKQRLIELKTSRIMDGERQVNTFRRHKTLTWWLQSYFAGIDLVVCGYRNDHGIVTEIDQYKTMDLPRYAKGWNTNVCLNFCCDYLTFIKEVLTAELKRQGYAVGEEMNVKSYPVINVILHRNPRSPVTVDKPLQDEDVNILDDWFLQMLSE